MGVKWREYPRQPKRCWHVWRDQTWHPFTKSWHCNKCLDLRRQDLARYR